LQATARGSHETRSGARFALANLSFSSRLRLENVERPVIRSAPQSGCRSKNIFDLFLSIENEIAVCYIML
jgi:hypothetical protein